MKVCIFHSVSRVPLQSKIQFLEAQYISPRKSKVTAQCIDKQTLIRTYFMPVLTYASVLLCMCALPLRALFQYTHSHMFPTHLCYNTHTSVTACFSGCAPAPSGSGRVLSMRTRQHLLICGRTSGVCLPPSLTLWTLPQTPCTQSSSRGVPECLAPKRAPELKFGLGNLLSSRQGRWLERRHEACG